MSAKREPELESRRQKELEAELLERARAWLPDWRPRDSSNDFASALFSIAARLESEVTQRLARVPEKSFLGFLHWLGVSGRPGLAARLPVVFSLTSGSDPVDAARAVQMQASPAGVEPITLETEGPLRILPARLQALIAADPQHNAIYLPPPGLFNLEPPPALPRRWRLVSAAPQGARQLQLEPELGLQHGIVLLQAKTGQRYQVSGVEGSIVSIEPALENDASAGEVVTLLDALQAFAEQERSVQEHVLFLGATNALDVATPAVIEVIGAGTFPADVSWSFWGKAAGAPDAAWVGVTPKFVDGSLFLIKPAGAVEEKQIGTRKSRWLRAKRGAAATLSSIHPSALQLKVNCKPTPPPPNTPSPDDPWPAAIAAAFASATSGSVKTTPELEGVATTAPLVLTSEFYPLGREPRLFDAFYIGSKEIFSKPAAHVTLRFKIGGSFSAPLIGVELGREYFAAGVTDDGKLCRLWLTGDGGFPARPSLDFLALTEPPKADDGKPRPFLAGFRPGATASHEAAHVSAVANDKVWLLVQRSKAYSDAWKDLGAPSREDATGAPAFGDTLLLPAKGSIDVWVVLDGKLYRRNLLSKWRRDAKAPTDIARIVPITQLGASAGDLDDAKGLASVTNKGELYLCRDDAWTKFESDPEKPALAFDSDFYPIISADGPSLWCVAKRIGSSGLIAVDLVNGVVEETDSPCIGRSASVVGPDALRTLSSVLKDGVERPLLWSPFDGDPDAFGEAVAGAGLFDGPVVLGPWAVFPCGNGVVAVAPCLVAVSAPQQASVANALVLSSSKDLSQAKFVRAKRNGAPLPVSRAVSLPDEQWALELTEVSPALVDATVFGLSDEFQGTWASLNELVLDADDVVTKKRGHIQISNQGKLELRFVESVSVDKKDARTAHLKLPVHPDTPATYRVLVKLDSASQVASAPSLDISALSPSAVSSLPQRLLRFEDLHPSLQRAEPLSLDGAQALLTRPWRQQPATSPFQVTFELVEGLGGMFVFVPPRPQSPDLYWEYFDGRSWWKIPGLSDSTSNLLQTGNVEFCVPADLAPSEVVGRTNHWVRARLVSGNYGQASTTVISKPRSGGGTEQTVSVNTDSLRPPFVLKLEAFYEICCAVYPDFVLSEDSKTLREQSDSNLASNAQLELFVPLQETLSKLGNADDAAPDSELSGGVALYLGFDRELKGGPINLLFLVDEGDDGAFPLRVEALLGGHFQRVVSQDETRGLSQSGIVSISLADSPQSTSLFGSAGFWLRLRPAAGFAGAWRPSIRGVYLNAAWAIAADTQAYETAGSSDGSPHQRLTLARPPVLENSLVLRVREPLGDEERQALEQAQKDAVTDELSGRPGPWVLWREVADLAEAGPYDRVYALDSQSGIVSFGDGRFGRVPPIGRDAILAERYLRGGGDAANRIGRFTPISLSTPLQGVDSVVAPSAAAGGADPQDRSSAVRFAPANLNARDRVLQLRDFEALALQFSRDIAQVKVSPTRAGVRLVVVTKGADARPGNALLRELKAHLLARAVPSFSAPGALELRGPTLVPLRFRLHLSISAIEQSGPVSAAATKHIQSLLDPEHGGLDGEGWRLGELPTESDIAACLVGLEYLESIDSCVLSSEDGEGVVVPALVQLEPHELARLVAGGVSVECRVASTEVA